MSKGMEIDGGLGTIPVVEYEQRQERIRRQREALEWLEGLDEDQLEVVRTALLEDGGNSKKPCPSCGLMLSETRKPVIHLTQSKVHRDMTETERDQILAEW